MSRHPRKEVTGECHGTAIPPRRADGAGVARVGKAQACKGLSQIGLSQNGLSQNGYGDEVCSESAGSRSKLAREGSERKLLQRVCATVSPHTITPTCRITLG